VSSAAGSWRTGSACGRRGSVISWWSSAVPCTPRSRGLTAPTVFVRWGHFIPWGVEPQRVTEQEVMGRGLDRSRVVAQRGAVLPGAAVAPGADGLKHGVGWGLWCRAAEVCSEAAQEGCTGPWKHVWRADDRLMHTTQTEWERAWNIIRSQQVRDRALQPQSASTRRSDWTAYQPAVQGWGGLAATVGTVPCLLQFRIASRQFAAAPGCACGNHGAWLGQAVAAVYARDGGRLDGPCLVAARGLALSGAAVATTAAGLRHGAGEWAWRAAAAVWSEEGHKAWRRGC